MFADLFKGLQFQLTDPFAGDIEDLTDLRQSHAGASVKAVTHRDDLFFPFGQLIDDFTEPFPHHFLCKHLHGIIGFLVAEKRFYR